MNYTHQVYKHKSHNNIKKKKDVDPTNLLLGGICFEFCIFSNVLNEYLK